MDKYEDTVLDTKNYEAVILSPGNYVLTALDTKNYGAIDRDFEDPVVYDLVPEV